MTISHIFGASISASNIKSLLCLCKFWDRPNGRKQGALVGVAGNLCGFTSSKELIGGTLNTVRIAL